MIAKEYKTKMALSVIFRSVVKRLRDFQVPQNFVSGEFSSLIHTFSD